MLHFSELYHNVVIFYFSFISTSPFSLEKSLDSLNKIYHKTYFYFNLHLRQSFSVKI